ncbi:MAG: GDSL-type esterase/lipase family protein [Candidatus Lernaella stagnicola]|nr:GDSL-type esterase/lipase family protein [Candidatus Lernaella stagnicola]
MSSSAKKVLVGVGALVLVSVFILGGWEIALRITAPQPEPSRPDFERLNPDVAAGTRRVLLVGDSFVEGVGVSPLQRIGPRVEHYLDAQEPATVLAVGQPGAGQAAELQAIEHYLSRWRPEVVVLVFLPANDVMNNSFELEPKKDKLFYHLVDGRLVLKPGVAAPREDGGSLRVVGEIRRRLGFARQKQELIDAGEGVPLDFWVYATNETPPWQEAWHVTYALLDRIRERVEAGGAQLVIAVVGERWRVDAAAFLELLARYPEMQKHAWDTARPAKRITQWCADHGVACVDLGPSFAALNAGHLFLPDGHWSAAGHELAALQVARALHSEHERETGE